MSAIYNFFGFILRWFYQFTHSFGIALILFTLLTRILMLPLGVKQQKNTIKQIKLQPKERLIRKKYAYDKNLQQQKVMEFYQKEGFNPMAGCLPLLIQLPIMLILYRVIQQPLTYISQYTAADLSAIVEKLQTFSLSATQQPLLDTYLSNTTYNQVSLMQLMGQFSDQLGTLYRGLPNYTFLGIDLIGKPSLSQFNTLLLIPLAAAVTALIQTLISQSTSKYISQNQQGGSNTVMMMLMGPVMQLLFTFWFNAGIGLYWVITNIFMILQTLLLNAVMSPKQAAADAHYELVAAVEARKKKKALAAQERKERIEQEQLERKNAARKAAGQKPLESLEKSADNQENENGDNEI